MNAPPRIITIVCRDAGKGDFDIHEGERVTTRLCWDEMLGGIATITHPQLANLALRIPSYSRLTHIDDVLEQSIFWAKKDNDEPDFREVGE